MLQANKNGFFYVLDRQTGEFLSAAPFVSGITWASGIDPKTGRPIELPESRIDTPKLLVTGPGWGAQLEPDGIPSRHRPRVLPRAPRHTDGARARQEMEVQPGSRQRRYRRQL